MNLFSLPSNHISAKADLEPILNQDPHDARIGELLKKHLEEMALHWQEKDPSAIRNDLEFMSHLVEQRDKEDEKSLLQRVLNTTAHVFSLNSPSSLINCLYPQAMRQVAHYITIGERNQLILANRRSLANLVQTQGRVSFSHLIAKLNPQRNFSSLLPPNQSKGKIPSFSAK